MEEYNHETQYPVIIGSNIVGFYLPAHAGERPQTDGGSKLLPGHIIEVDSTPALLVKVDMVNPTGDTKGYVIRGHQVNAGQAVARFHRGATNSV